MDYLLGDLRRTHYSKDVNPDISGEEVLIMGWVHEIRDLGGIIFVIIRDRDGLVQITAPSKKVDASILDDLRALRKESVVAIKGTVQDAGKAPNGVEIIPLEGYSTKYLKEDIKIAAEKKRTLCIVVQNRS